MGSAPTHTKSGVAANVRLGSLADIGQPIRDVRFAPESDIFSVKIDVCFVPKADIFHPGFGH